MEGNKCMKKDKDLMEGGSVSGLREDFKQFLNELLTLLPAGARNFLKGYSREILSCVIVLVLAIVLFAGYSSYIEGQERRAATLFGSAIHERDLDKKVHDLKTIVKEHGSTDTASIALAVLARAEYNSGNRERALEYFEKAERNSSRDHELYATSLMGQGYILEETGKPKEAVKKFDQAIQTDIGFEKIALLDKARAAKAAGETAKGLDALNRLLSENPGPRELEFVKFELLDMKRK